jgi:hypothetical protein
MNYEPMALRFFGMMRHGATRMRRGVLSGQTEQQALAGCDAARAKVFHISLAIKIINISV